MSKDEQYHGNAWGVYWASTDVGRRKIKKINPANKNRRPALSAAGERKEEKRRLVYIAGAITGNSFYKGQFRAQAKRLKEAGFEVLNPAEMPQKCGMSYRDYIDLSHELLKRADCVYFLKGFEGSKGAVLELAYCAAVGIEVINEPIDRSLLICGWSNLINSLRGQKSASKAVLKGK